MHSEEHELGRVGRIVIRGEVRTMSRSEQERDQRKRDRDGGG